MAARTRGFMAGGFAMHTLQLDRTVIDATAGLRQMDGNHVIGVAGKDFTRITDAIFLIRHANASLPQVQLATVPGDVRGLMPFYRHVQLGQHHQAAEVPRRVLELTIVTQQHIAFSEPHRGIGEVKKISRRTATDQGTKTPVADRQALAQYVRLRRRRAIPKRMPRCRRRQGVDGALYGATFGKPG